MKSLLGVLGVWLVFAGVMCGICFGFYHEERVQIPVGTEVERAIEVESLQNKFVFARHMALGGAGGGGMGTAMVICSSPQQFVDLVPEEEPIFVAFEFPVVEEGKGLTTNYSIKKVYWAFLENRAGLMAYEDEYSYDGYWVEKYTPEIIYFYYHNWGAILAVLIVGGICGAVVAIIGSVLVYNKLSR